MVIAAPLSQSNPGVLSCEVWPTYVGLCEETAPPIRGQWFLREPVFSINYQRGQIVWETDTVTRKIIGHARVYVPPGEYTHILFATAEQGHIVDCKRREHPIRMDDNGWIDIDPIRKSTVLARGVK